MSRRIGSDRALAASFTRHRVTETLRVVNGEFVTGGPRPTSRPLRSPTSGQLP